MDGMAWDDWSRLGWPGSLSDHSFRQAMVKRQVKVTFHGCVQDSQEYGSDDEHMVSRVFFTIEIEGKKHEGLYADLKQTAGSSYETGPIEVGWPVGYKGPFNHHAFQTEAAQYFRELVGGQGSMIRIEPGATNIRMQDNRFGRTKVVEFEASESAEGW